NSRAKRSKQNSRETRGENVKVCLKAESENYHRRPGLEPGPIRGGLSARALASDTFCNNERRGVWIPAFARTTPSKTHDDFLGVAASKETSSLTIPAPSSRRSRSGSPS